MEEPKLFKGTQASRELNEFMQEFEANQTDIMVCLFADYQDRSKNTSTCMESLKDRMKQVVKNRK